LKGRVVPGGILLLLLAAPAFAGPFADVPRTDSAYRDSAVLSKAGVLNKADTELLSSGKALTRYDFALMVLEPLSVISDMASDKRGDADQTALAQALQTMSRSDRMRLGTAIAALASEFGDVLALISEDYASGIEAASALALNGAPSVPLSTRNPAERRDSSPLSYSVLGARLALTYRRSDPDAPPFEYVAALRLAGAPASAATPRASMSGRPALSDLGLTAVGGSLEYGIAEGLRLNLGYEALLMDGSSNVTVDPARLKTVGLAYRLSGSTDVRLKYQLIERRESPNVAPAEAHLAATELTVRF
jgi:hypothetical protein